MSLEVSMLSWQAIPQIGPYCLLQKTAETQNLEFKHRIPLQLRQDMALELQGHTWTEADRGIPDSPAVLDVLEALVQRKDGGQRWGQMLHVINRLVIWTLVPVRPNYCLFSFCFCSFYWKPGSTQTSSAVLVSTIGILRSHSTWLVFISFEKEK